MNEVDSARPQKADLIWVRNTQPRSLAESRELNRRPSTRLAARFIAWQLFLVLYVLISKSLS